MAGGVRFERTEHIPMFDGFQDRCIQPLYQPPMFVFSFTQVNDLRQLLKTLSYSHSKPREGKQTN